MQNAMTEAAVVATNGVAAKRRPRTGKKRLKFGPPQVFPRGVRELWTTATAAEQQAAHRACAQILAMWLGRRRREEVARELEIPPLRVWQLSQQALSGMLAGLLHQPKARRGKESETMILKDDDPRFLKKRITELEKRLSDSQGLVDLLAQLPKPKENELSEPASQTSAPEAKTRKARARAIAEGSRGRVLEEPPAAAR